MIKRIPTDEEAAISRATAKDLSCKLGFKIVKDIIEAIDENEEMTVSDFCALISSLVATIVNHISKNIGEAEEAEHLINKCMATLYLLLEMNGFEIDPQKIIKMINNSTVEEKEEN